MPQINCISFSYDRCRMDGTYHKMPIIILQDDVICLHRKKYQVGPRLGNMPPTSIFRKFLKKTNRCRILHITNSFIEACYKLRKSDIFCFFSQYIIGESFCSMFFSNLFLKLDTIPYLLVDSLNHRYKNQYSSFFRHHIFILIVCNTRFHVLKKHTFIHHIHTIIKLKSLR